MKKFLLLALVGFSFQLYALPSQVLIIRHGEKTGEGNSLSLKGKERAAALIPFFMETKEFLTNGTPAAIYAVQSSDQNPSQRPVETVQSLADKLKITLNTKYVQDNYKKMVDEIKSDPTYHGKTVLICWEHTVIPEIARAFGALQTPGRWSSEAYDRVWKINFNTSGRASFENLAQKLMYGDTPN
jgi:hypothetical protein